MQKLKVFFLKNITWIYTLEYIAFSIVLLFVVSLIDLRILPIKDFLPDIIKLRVDFSQGILTSLAAAFLTITTFTFSTILTVLNTYASSFTPRVVENFINRKITLKVVGIFIGGFFYCNPDISFPMQFECIANHVSKQKHHKNVYTLLKEEIASKVKEIKTIDDKEMVPHSYFLKNKQYQRILTTNYDYVIEDYLKHTYNIADEDITASQKEIKYSLRRYRKLQDTYIFHIHGEAGKPETLCLGYEHYAGSIQYLRSKLALKEKSPLLHVLKNKQVTPDIIETYSWAILFLIDDIEIIGLGLDESEIDLWWLISYRAYLKNMHPEASRYIQNTITYHEVVHPASEQKYLAKRKSLFESMDIQYKMHEVKHSNYLESYYDIAKAIE